MSNTNPKNDKKKALLAYKEKILQDIQYYDKRIEDFGANQKNNCYYDSADSSDSEDYFPNVVDVGPEATQLKLQQAMIKTCLHATQELTSLTVLQSEVNVLVQDPQFDGEPPVTEAGTWKEVTAECRIDLVPFTITFYMHTPSHTFAPTTYRGVQVSLIKSAHEAELNKSVLHSLKTPSDAVEVVRSYAVGHRSRRTTLARLANKYAGSLFMEPHPEGGFVLKCGNLLEILWRLENKWSQVAPFHHRMKFDLEYMDESYIKIITQAHKQLLDPSLQTDERTLLLSKIIATCLEATTCLDSGSDLEFRQTGMQPETETTEPKDKDSEVMAPPKTLPKKTKKVAAKDKNVKELGKDANLNKDMATDMNLNKETASKNVNKDFVKDKNANKELTKDKNANKELAKDKKNTNKELTKDKNANKELAKDKNAKKDLVKDKTSAQKRSIEDENKEETQNNAKKIKTNDEGGAKKSSKVKEKARDVNNDDNRKKADKLKKSSNADNDGIKKKPNEAQDIAKKPKNNDMTKKISKNNKQNENTNIDENNKNATNTNAAQKRKNDNVLEDAPMTNDVKGPKKSKSNEEIKRKNVENAETNPKKVKSNIDDNKIDKQTKNKDVVPKNSKNVKNTNVGNKDINGKEQEEPNTKQSNEIAEKGEVKKKNNKNGAANKQAKSDEPVEVINDDENKESGTIKAKNTKEKNKNAKDNENTKKVDRKTKMSIANDNKFDQITKKISSLNKDAEKNHDKNVVNTKTSIENKNNDNVENNKGEDNKKNKNVEKKTVANAKNMEAKQNTILKKQKSDEIVKNKNTGNSKDVNTVTEKNATNFKNKEKIANINKAPEKLIKIKLITKNDKMNSGPKTPNKKLALKSVRDLIHKSPKNKNALKPQNPLKTTKSISNGNTQTFFGNIEKEIGAKISKIPQKSNSLNSIESSLKKNMLRVSPRILPSKFKSISKDTNTKNMMKSTNIPRLMKKPVPKT